MTNKIPNNKTKSIQKQSKNKTQNKINPRIQDKPNHKIETDERFSKAQYDPKFLVPSSKITKTKIDKRFAKMMSDPSFKITSKTDRYGRLINQTVGNKELEQYYYMDNEELESNQSNVDESEKSNLSQQNDIEQQQSQNGEDIRQWMENYDQQSSQIQDLPQQQINDKIWEDEDDNLIKNDKVEITCRLALCNYDWMNLNAKDLMTLFSSFKSAVGYIKSIRVYVSEIGKQKLKQQQLQGPQGIWKQNQNDQQANDKNRKSWKELLEQRSKDDNDGIDEKKLRRYEKDRLKYFYAVIECDSKKTADNIYRQCDGNQFQNSNLQFDLRFIPDEIIFDQSNLRDQCNQIPVSGEVKNFVNRALGHSKVTLSWQDPQLSLVASLKKKNWNKMSEQQLNKIDWGIYIDEQELNEDDNMKRLINTNKNEEDVLPQWKKLNNKKYRKNDDDIEITFDTGFQKKSNKPDFPSLNKQKKSLKEKRREADQLKQKKREQLQLIVDQKQKVNFTPNLHDDRFHAVYNNPSFAIDPVDPKFDHRKSGKIFEEVVKINKRKNKE